MVLNGAGVRDTACVLGVNRNTVSIYEDNATIDAQFMQFDTLGAERPENGWATSYPGIKRDSNDYRSWLLLTNFAKN